MIALDQVGISTAVATCGTALGEDHFRLLARFAQGEDVVLAFDSDDAGARAAERAYAFHQQFPMKVSVLILPAGEDPADFILARSDGAADAFQEYEGYDVPTLLSRDGVHPSVPKRFRTTTPKKACGATSTGCATISC